MLTTVLKGLGLVLAALVLLAFGLWGVGALWFQGPENEAARLALVLIWAALALAGAVGIPWRRLRPAAYGFAAAAVALLGWWATITPSNQRDWLPELSRGVTASFEGDTVVVHNIRDFVWRSETDYTPNWVDRRYNLDDLSGVDMFMTYWAGPSIAHMIVSFGFKDGRQLAFSVEIRRPKGVEYSPVAGFFKRYEQIFIAADERDVIGLRHVRPEESQLYRIRVDPKRARGLLVEYLKRANEMAAHPRFYHTVLSNCTTEVFSMVRAAGFDPPWDYRILANGYLPQLAWSERLLDERHSVEELGKLGRVDDRFPPLPIDSVAFSSRIRDGVPTPAPMR